MAGTKFGFDGRKWYKSGTKFSLIYNGNLPYDGRGWGNPPYF